MISTSQYFFEIEHVSKHEKHLIKRTFGKMDPIRAKILPKEFIKQKSITKKPLTPNNSILKKKVNQ